MLCEHATDRLQPPRLDCIASHNESCPAGPHPPQAHLTCVNNKGAAAGGKAAPAKAPPPAKGAAPVAAAPTVDVDGALAIVQNVLSNRAGDPAAANASLREAWAKVDPKPNESSRDVKLIVVAKVGFPHLLWCILTFACISSSLSCGIPDRAEAFFT